MFLSDTMPFKIKNLGWNLLDFMFISQRYILQHLFTP